MDKCGRFAVVTIMNILYSIKNLHQYFIDKNGEKKTILKVENLHILENKFTVILGNSGSGKTTLLEILGSINQIDEGDVIYKPNFDNISLKKLWKDKNAHSAFLRKKLAFTFQEANLLSHYNVEENIAIPLVIENDFSIQKAVKQVTEKNILTNFGISKIREKKIEVISGGEQQRVALARSSNSYFDVFLTDEPTGNVGLKHEDVIFQYLRKLVNTEKKSVIVVTHNIQKALEYADQLIIITQTGNSGIITPENVLNLDNKLNSCLLTLNGQLLNIPIFSPLQNAMTVFNPTLLNIIKNRMGGMDKSIRIETRLNETEPDSFIEIKENNRKNKSGYLNIINRILAVFNNTVEKQINFLAFFIVIPFLKTILKSRHYQFVESFITRDIKGFFKGKVFSFLIIFILSLFAISSYTAWDKILKKKLSNPFVNVLLVKNNSSKSLTELSNKLLSPEFKKRYYTKMVTPTQSVSLRFINKQNPNEYSYITGRTLNEDDPLLKKLTEYIEEKSRMNNENLGLFVTKSFLEKLGYSAKDNFIKVTIANRNHYLPVIGVFKFLPGDTFIITNKYYKIINSGGLYYDTADFIALADINNSSFKNDFSDYLKSKKIDISSIVPILNGLKFKFLHSYKTSYLDSIWNEYKLAKNIKSIKQFYPPNMDFIPAKTETTHYDWFFLHRNKIKHSEQLKQKLSKMKLQIDIEKISTQKDFRTISSLLKIAILFMEIITLLSTLVFIKYSFYIHIFQLRKELGIIKSLGINEITINQIFRYENAIFYFSVMSLGFFYLFILQLINFVLIKLNILSYYVFSVLSINTFFHIVFLYLVSVVALEYTIDKLVILPAGDLIYDRIEK